MPSPVMQSLPSVGNLIAATSLVASATQSVNNGILLDLSSVFEGQISIRMTTSASSAATSGLSINAYYVYASTTTSTTITLNSTTSITVASANGFAAVASGGTQLIAIVNGSNAEIITATALSGTTLTITKTLNSYSGTTTIYFISQTPPIGAPVLGLNAAVGSATYGCELFLPTGEYFLSLANLDTSNAITVEVTGRNITGVA